MNELNNEWTMNNFDNTYIWWKSYTYWNNKIIKILIKIEEMEFIKKNVVY